MTFCCSLKVLTPYYTSLLLLEKLLWPLLLKEMTPCLSMTWMMTSLQEKQQLFQPMTHLLAVQRSLQ